MGTNQLHGKIYEDHLKSVFPGSSDHGRPPHSLWDIEPQYDKDKHLPTSIKTAKNKGKVNIDLADARKFWSIKEPYRMLVAVYDQVGGVKRFHTLYEFLISEADHQKLLGSVSYSEVESFHNNLLTYGEGLHAQCRVFAKQRKASLKDRSIIQLNAKIDSKTQRRLQCSVSLVDLLDNVPMQTTMHENDFYKGISVNFTMQNGEREFNK